MTFSIVARDPEAGLVGIAAASRFFALGAFVPHASAAGGLATQALVNPTYGPRGLRLLAEGLPASRVVEALTALDDGRDQRQLHVVDRHGCAAAWTGGACVDWCGHVAGPGVSVAGNMLAGPAVLDATLETFLAEPTAPLAARLLAAMDAGEAAGGDKRGRQSAVLLVQGADSYPRLSIRVDDHAEPLIELRRLYAVAGERFLPFSTAFPTGDLDPGITDRAEIDRRIEAGARPAGF